MIRPGTDIDFDTIFAIINEAAEAVIPVRPEQHAGSPGRNARLSSSR
jgi:hypothetical protein